MGTRNATVKIGTFTLKETHKFRKSYETASWYTDVEVPPGDYDLRAAFRYNENPEHSEGYAVGVDIDVDHAYVTLPGLIASSYFIDSLFGHYGKPKIDEDKGQKSEYHLHLYGYNMASAVAEHGGNFMQGKAKITLDPAFEVRPTFIGQNHEWNEVTKAYDLLVPYQSYGVFHAAAPTKEEVASL
jgi:hypothetical protein